MPRTQTSENQRLVLHDVPWQMYERALRTFDERPLRLTFDRGALEIMTLSPEHEWAKYLLGRFVDVLTEECGLPVKAGGSTTFRRRRLHRGLEPDNCYWIANEPRVRGKTTIDLKTDPPPDLAWEIDISRSSLNRMGIYARLRVPEVWRYDGENRSFHVLGSDGRYQEATCSPTFPFLQVADVLRFLALRATRAFAKLAA